MTREEAIKTNKSLKMHMLILDMQKQGEFLDENYIALDMAIHALEAENNVEITPKDALDVTERLVYRVLEILPNIIQSVIDAMPDAIEKYLKEREGQE